MMTILRDEPIGKVQRIDDCLPTGVRLADTANMIVFPENRAHADKRAGFRCAALRVGLAFLFSVVFLHATSAAFQLNFPVRKNVAGASCPSNLRLEATATEDFNSNLYVYQSTSFSSRKAIAQSPPLPEATQSDAISDASIADVLNDDVLEDDPEANPFGFKFFGYLQQGVTLNPDSPNDRTNGLV